MPPPNIYPLTKQLFTCYNPIKTSFLAVVVALYHFHFNFKQVTLILVLLMFNIYRMVFLALKKVWMVKITPKQIFSTQWKSSSLHQNPPFPRWQGRFPPYPSNAIWKTLACFTFQSQGVEIISTHFSVWLWTVTQFNTSKNEMSLKLLLVIGNEFLIYKWKYWIWISKNESILRTNKCKRIT